MANHLKISEGSLRHHLEKMKCENLIRRSGSDKGGKWLVIAAPPALEGKGISHF
jgi:hypothetical protein